MDKILQENAYGILGVKASSSQSEIRKRSKKITRYLDMERNLDIDLDFEVYHKVRSEESVKRAAERLTHPEKKIIDAFFWFNEAETIDKEAINLLKNEEYEKAIGLWDKKIQESSDSYPLSQKNLALLYCILLPQKGDKVEDYLKKSLSLWREIINSDKFWKAYTRFYQLYDEIDTSEEVMLKFKEDVEGYISDLYTELYNFHEGEDLFISQQSNFLSVIGDKLKKEVFTPIYKEIIDEVEKIESMGISEDGVFDEQEESELEDSIDNIKFNFQRLSKLNLRKGTKVKDVQDRAAKAIKTAVLDIHNNLEETEKAIPFMEKALEIAGTSYMKSQVESDICTLQNMKVAKPIKDLMEEGRFKQALGKINSEREKYKDNDEIQDIFNKQAKACIFVMAKKKHEKALNAVESNSGRALKLFRNTGKIIYSNLKFLNFDENIINNLIDDLIKRIESLEADRVLDNFERCRKDFIRRVREEFGDKEELNIMVMLIDSYVYGALTKYFKRIQRNKRISVICFIAGFFTIPWGILLILLGFYLRFKEVAINVEDKIRI